MICGHCQSREVSVGHVRACANNEQAIRSIGRFEVTGPALQTEPRPEPSTLATRANNGEDIEGVYYLNGFYYKVVRSPNTGNFYAKESVFYGSEGRVEWDYEGRRPLYRLTEEHRVTADQAARFGAITGQCVFCGRGLTDERSIAVGYGPVCAEHNGLPWGEKPVVSVESHLPEAPEWTI